MSIHLTAREALAAREIISSLGTIVGIFLGVAIALALSRLRLRWDWALTGLPLSAVLWLAGSPLTPAALAATVTTLALALLSRLLVHLEGREDEDIEEIGPLQLALALLPWPRSTDPFDCSPPEKST